MKEGWNHYDNDLLLPLEKYGGRSSGYDVPTIFRNLQNMSFTYFTCRECGTLQTRCPLWFTVKFSVR